MTRLRLLLILICASICQPLYAQQDDVYAHEISAAIEAYNADEYAIAREHFMQAHALRPSARTWRGLGTTAFELKSYDDAVRELTFALEDTRNALPDALRAETELTLRVAQRRLADSGAPAPAPTPPEKPAAEPVDPTPASARDLQPRAASGIGAARITALVVGSAGVISLAAGIGFGMRSISQGQDRDRLCPPAQQPVCTPEAQQAADAAISSGDISTITFIAAGALLTTSVVLWLTGRPSQPSPTQLSVGPTGIAVSGAF
jgi:tetratricopeptide (TPR) repeat protein